MVIISGKKSPIDNCLKRLKYFHISSLFESLICLVFIPLWDRGSLASLVQPPSARKTKKLYLDLHKFSIFCSHFFRRRTIKILYFLCLRLCFLDVVNLSKPFPVHPLHDDEKDFCYFVITTIPQLFWDWKERKRFSLLFLFYSILIVLSFIHSLIPTVYYFIYFITWLS